tara:strand:+ start:202 stop:582 length:381 start_codon:yes stop_codon:yes gene_type:complete
MPNKNRTRKYRGGSQLPLSPAPFKSLTGGNKAIGSWLWGVSTVNKVAPHPAHHQKGGLSSQLVPLGLTAGVLASRSKKRRHYPRKGMPSRTRKGRLDFITHKGDKLYNRRGKRQNKNQLGTRRRPF